MSASSLRPLLDIIDRLASAWRQLDEGNEAFLSGEISAERLDPLLEQREVGFAESRHFEEELIVVFQECFPERKETDFGKIWDGLSREPAAEDRMIPARKALERLVESNKRVEERLKSAREDLNAQIKQTRKTGRALRGYTQANPMGSCFIDKIK
ncbi:MAG: hypothetical protein WA705_15790 [Candidatus Ozemobacteraceae bacterium]